MAPKAQSDSKRGLVVTLVFFILSTIGAGVAAYYGFAEQESLKQKAKTDRDKAIAADSERDWYRFQVALFRPYLGFPAAPDSPVGRELAKKVEFDAGTYGAAYKDHPEVKDIAAKLNARAPWDAAKAAPREILEDVIKARDKEIADLKVKLVKAEEERLLAQTAKTAAETARANDQISFKDAVDKGKQEFAKDRDGFNKQLADLTALLKASEDKKDEKWIQPIVKRNEQLEADNKTLAKRVKDLDEKLTQAAANSPAAAAEAITARASDPTPRGKIVHVHLNPKKATIDLGKIHGLTPQTTFAVHGYQTNGKPKLRSKANIEVINVGPTTSEVLITEVFHPSVDTDHVSSGKRKVIDVLHKDNTDPIVPGDALINPLWNPNAKTHIAIAGFIDLDGTGAINMASLVQILERQNVVVDAYIDPLDGSLKGKGISRRTDYLLLGGKLTGAMGAPKDEATIKEFDKNHEKLIQDAKVNAIPQKQPHVFFRETGFNLPRTVSSD